MVRVDLSKSRELYLCTAWRPESAGAKIRRGWETRPPVLLVAVAVVVAGRRGGGWGEASAALRVLVVSSGAGVATGDSHALAALLVPVGSDGARASSCAVATATLAVVELLIPATSAVESAFAASAAAGEMALHGGVGLGDGAELGLSGGAESDVAILLDEDLDGLATLGVAGLGAVAAGAEALLQLDALGKVEVSRSLGVRYGDADVVEMAGVVELNGMVDDFVVVGCASGESRIGKKVGSRSVLSSETTGGNDADTSPLTWHSDSTSNSSFTDSC